MFKILGAAFVLFFVVSLFSGLSGASWILFLACAGMTFEGYKDPKVFTQEFGINPPPDKETIALLGGLATVLALLFCLYIVGKVGHEMPWMHDVWE